MVTNLTRETMASSVIGWPVGAIAKLNAIAKIYKYRGFNEGHHFILMTMEVHDAPGHDVNCFIRECAFIFPNRQLKGHLSLSFYIQFSKQHVSITLQCVLAFAIKRKIALMNNACSRPLITIISHNLNVGDIRRAVGEIASYHERDYLSFFFWSLQAVPL